ncbi:MAG TPA: hypothetical protein VFI45_02610 [Candidatus Acidoferrum sp.]|nr:hypothetical protein [Candidatus Acidoferrum sp.]
MVTSYLIREVLCTVMLATAVTASQEITDDAIAVSKQSSIIFLGTVQLQGETSFADVPKSTYTIVVRVDLILKKPTAVMLREGENVTVLVKDPAKFPRGAHAKFYTDGWIFGSGVSVKELGHEIRETILAANEERILSERINRQIEDQDLRSRVNSADIIVVAQVLEIRPWAAPSSDTRRRYISEHDPQWQEAVLEIQEALKGAESHLKIVLRFASSYDVAWVNSPKFKPGEQRLFLLAKDHITGEPKALVSGSQPDAYIALDPGDVLSITDAPRVRARLTN